ncbi:MAG: tetratricopeptide repeat protein [Bdellovibrionales bacterium]|nr:tetratricopeptide repeat protein [Bdellovibrionales bacterium]
MKRLLLLGGVLLAGALAFASDRLASAVGGTDRAMPSHDSVSEQYRQEIAFWERELEKDPYSFIAIERLAIARLALARATGDETQFEAAERELGRAASFAPQDDVTRPLLLARTFMARHAFADALAEVDAVLKRSAEHFAAKELRSDILLSLGRYDEAFAAAEELARLNPSHGTWARLAEVRELQGRSTEAKLLLEQALAEADRLNPEPAAWLYLRYGIHFLKQKEYARAEQAFRDSLSVAPDYYLALEHLAEVYELTDRPEEALPLLRKAIAIRPAPALQVRLAALLQEQEMTVEADQLEKAAHTLMQAQALRDPAAHGRDYVESMLATDGDVEELISYVEQDLAARPGDLRSNLVAAQVYSRAGRPDLARKHLELAARLPTSDRNFATEISALRENISSTVAR